MGRGVAQAEMVATEGLSPKLVEIGLQDRHYVRWWLGPRTLGTVKLNVLP